MVLKRKCLKMALIGAPEYHAFRQNLNYIIDDTDIKTKEQLSFLMAQRGFRKNKHGQRFYPSEKQLTLAWDYIISTGYDHKVIDNILYRQEKYKKATIKRVIVKNIVYKNKTYRKGQFLPKDYE
jgi:hypothetical protein